MATESTNTDDLLLERRKDIRQDFIKSAKKAFYRKYTPILVLGAGISISAELPGWKKLVSALFGYGLVSVRHNLKQYEKQKFEQAQISRETELIDALVNGDIGILDSGNVLEAGQYIEEMLGNAHTEAWVRNEEIKEVLGLIIDKGTDAETKKKELEENSGDKKVWAKENSLLAVAYLLSSGKGFHQAITYNYDTYVEEYMQVVYPSDNKIISHIDRWNQHQPSDHSAEIFHVHGCVPTKYFRDKDNKEELEPWEPRESNTIILSEDSYYDVEDSEAYNWMNSVQSDALNRNTCFFVGFSGEDYNFRRILRQLGRYQEEKRPRHYMLVSINSTYDSIKNECNKKWGAEAEEYAKILLDRVLMAKEEYWGRFGFYPIWVTWSDIPEVLLSLVPEEPDA